MSKLGYSKDNPYHVSVAALLTNNSGHICVHHFKKEDLVDESEGVTDLYLLMRETMHDNETLEQAVHRGLGEEYGAEGIIKRYIGSIQSHFPYKTIPGKYVEKTTLYFHVVLTTIDQARREVGAVETRSSLLWLEPADLLKKFEHQFAIHPRTDLDDSKIIRDFINHGC